MDSWLTPGLTVGLLDESGTSGDGRALLAGLTLTNDLDGLNRVVDAARERWRDSYVLEGNRNYSRFERVGFHYSSDPLPVIQSFIDTVGQLPNVRSVLCLSDRSVRPPDRPGGIPDADRLLLLYLRLAETAIRYCRTTSLRLIFEENSSLSRGALDAVGARAVERTRRAHPHRSYPEVAVEVGSKGAPSALSVVDYVVAVFARWHACGMPDDAQNSSFQQYKAIERNIAAVELFDQDRRSNRRNRAFH